MTDFSRRGFLGVVIGGSLGLAMPAFGASQGIDESGFVRIGGIDQWIAIQGSNVRNPVLLYLHGGPGEAQSPFLGDFAAWQRDFTVVNWDQRGAGKTYEMNGKATPDVTMARLTADAVEIAQYVLAKLGQKKLILVGQSYGSALGLLVAQQAPELFTCSVGTSQMVGTALSVEGWEQWTRAEAVRRNDVEGLKALDAAAGSDLLSRERMVAAHKWVFGSADQPYLDRMAAFTGSPERPNPEAAAWLEGSHFEAGKLARENFVLDMRQKVTGLAVPYVLIQGREDHVTPTAPAKAYYNQLRAPAKTFVEIGGGHFACFTDTEEFLAALRTHVLPLAKQSF
jgi:pimeloyl-ACP methyl ester carboxylesterase